MEFQPSYTSRGMQGASTAISITEVMLQWQTLTLESCAAELQDCAINQLLQLSLEIFSGDVLEVDSWTHKKQAMIIMEAQNRYNFAESKLWDKSDRGSGQMDTPERRKRSETISHLRADVAHLYICPNKQRGAQEINAVCTLFILGQFQLPFFYTCEGKP